VVELIVFLTRLPRLVCGARLYEVGARCDRELDMKRNGQIKLARSDDANCVFLHPGCCSQVRNCGRVEPRPSPNAVTTLLRMQIFAASKYRAEGGMHYTAPALTPTLSHPMGEGEPLTPTLWRLPFRFGRKTRPKDALS
jgi:hypothetical protein